MNKIKILSPEQASKIAAGEVVERPSNIVKEILENSIDAGSTQISLYIKDSGKTLIRVVDNGSGMNAQDALLCFEKHATSKIENIQDLENIASFGFRGEALASISAVSKVTLITKTQEQELGTKIVYYENKLHSQESVSSPTGTNLQINDLFFNLPVRKKFLKQDETEFNQILNIFNAFCLSNININFKLFKDEKLVINAPVVQDLKNRIAQLWGHNLSESMLELSPFVPSDFSSEKSYRGITISGLTSNHNLWRYGKHQIFFFVNNRYIKDTELNKALFKGYSGVLPPAKFPASFIFINTPNNFVDINVHPKKEEVRFLKPHTVTNLLQRVIKETLDANVRSFIKPNVNNFTGQVTPSPFVPPVRHPDLRSHLGEVGSHLGDDISDTALSAVIPGEQHPAPACPSKLEERSRVIPAQEPGSLSCTFTKIYTPTPTFKIIGQYLTTYIIIQSETNLIIIDQHAAHERIIYDNITKNFEKKSGIKLMFPEIINLNNFELENIKLAQEFLALQGINIEPVGKNQLAIKSSPAKIQNQSLKELIFEILEFIKNGQNLDQELFRKKLNDKIHAQIACKSAVKAGDILTQEQMQEIVDNLYKTENLLTCPHGRPTTWILNKEIIEKQFKRKL